MKRKPKNKSMVQKVKEFLHFGRQTKKVTSSEEMKIPKEWIKKSKKAQDLVVVEKPKQRRKFKIPALRTVKRFIAFFLMVANFILAQVTLLSLGSIQLLYIFFMLNSFLALDYTWKTRRPPQPFEEFKQ